VGAWGTGPFDNDDAADWTYGFEGLDRDAGLRLIVDAFTATAAEPLHDYLGASAIAAASVVTWLLGDRQGMDSPYAEQAASWAARHPGPPSTELVASARAALLRVGSDQSELAALWEESGDEAWRQELQRIDSLLASGR
jgi:hypothetical protein